MATTRLIEVDVDQIEPDPHNVRSEYDPDIIRGLATFFKDQGTFIENPVVWKVGAMTDGRTLYRAFSGSTRAQAARSVGGRITVQVLPHPPEGSGKVLGQLAAGLVKGDLNAGDISRALLDLQQDGRRSVQDLVRELADWGIRRSRSWVFQHLHLTDLVPEVQAMVGRGELPVAAVNVLYTRSPEEQLRVAAEIANGRLRLSDVGQNGAAPAEAIQGEINQRLVEAGSLADERRRKGRVVSPEQRHGLVQSRRLLLGIEDPAGLARMSRRRALSVRQPPAAEWAAQASEEELALAREALHLGQLSPAEAIETVGQWQQEAETAPDDVLMAAHGLKRIIDAYTRNPAALAEYPGLMDLLRLRAGALTHIAGHVQKHAARS